MEEEIWRDVKGFEGYYQVSNYARVKSLARYVKCPLKNQKQVLKKERILKPILSKLERYHITLSKDGKKTQVNLSRIVADAFIPNPLNLKYAIHISNNKLDDRPENLKWSSMSDCQKDNFKCDRNNHNRSKIIYNKKIYKSKKHLANTINMNEDTFRARIRNGWSLDEAVKIKLGAWGLYGNKVKAFDYYGKIKTISQISKITGVDVETIRNRLRHGWDIYSASEIPKKEIKNEN